jgi:hypothetical protein
MRESTIEKAVCAYAKLKGCLIIKLAGQNQRGQPDRLFIRSGRCLFVEFKAPGKHPTALQLRWLANLNDHGMAVAWCDDIDRGKQFIDIIFS